MTRILILGMILVSLLAACAQPAYTPDAPTLAQREQAEYDKAQARGETAWKIGVGFMVLFLGILLVLSGFLSRVGYRVQAAKAAMKEAEVRRQDFIDLGGGKVYDIRAKTVIATGSTAPSQLPPVMPAQPLAQPTNGNRHAAFIKRAAHYHPEHYNGTTIPRFSKMGYASPHEWEEITKDLRGDGLIEVSETGTTICDGQNLGWLLSLVLTNPYD